MTDLLTDAALLPVVPTPEQAQVLRIFCEDGDLDWLGDIERFRRIMTKLDVCIKDIQITATKDLIGSGCYTQDQADGVFEQHSLEAANVNNTSGRRYDDLNLLHQEAHAVTIDDLTRKHLMEMQDLKQKLAEMQVVSLEEVDALRSNNTDLLKKYRRLENELESVTTSNSELLGKVQKLEQKLHEAATNILQLDADHKSQVDTLENQVVSFKAAAAAAEQKLNDTANAAARTIEQLKTELSNARQALQTAELEQEQNSHCRERVVELTAELQALNTQLVKQRDHQDSIEELHQQQVQDLQGKLSEAHQQTEDKVKELWAALSTTSTLQNQVDLQRIQLEQEVDKVKSILLKSINDEELLVFVSMLQDSLNDLQRNIEVSSQVSSRPFSSRFRRQVPALLEDLQHWTTHLLDRHSQAPASFSPGINVIPKKQLLQYQIQLVKLLQTALSDAVAADSQLETSHQQAEELRLQNRRIGELQLELQNALQENIIHKCAATELNLSIDRKSEELAATNNKLHSFQREVSDLHHIVQGLEVKLSQEQRQYNHELTSLQQQVHEQMQIVVDAYNQEIEAIRAQLLQPSSGQVPGYSPRPKTHSSPQGEVGGWGHSHLEEMQSLRQENLRLRSQQQQQQQQPQHIEGLSTESSSKSLPGGGTSSEGHPQLLQQAYVQLTKLQHKYKSLKHSYIKQTLRQHAIDEALLQQIGIMDAADLNDEQHHGASSDDHIPCTSGPQSNADQRAATSSKAKREQQRVQQNSALHIPSRLLSPKDLAAGGGRRLKSLPMEAESGEKARPSSRSRRIVGKVPRNASRPGTEPYKGTGNSSLK